MKKNSTNEFFENCKTIIFAIFIALIIRTFAAEPFNIPSGSMIPTLLIGDYLFVSKYSYGYSKHSLPFSLPLISGRILYTKPVLGDVAVFKTPTDNKTDFIKRIVGLPGDRVQVKNGTLYINGKNIQRKRLPDAILKDFNGNSKAVIRYEETLPNGRKYIVQEDDTNKGWLDNTPEFIVPKEHFFAMGDNRDNSSDSRVFGYIPINNLVGRAEFLFFSIKNSSAWKFWNWHSSVRVKRLFTGIE